MTAEERLIQIKTRATNEWLPELGSASEALKSAGPEGASREGYYGIPMLKPPTWSWHIATYFFLEGVSSGSFLMASLADVFGKGRLRELSRAGYYAAFATFLPCPALLVADLGRPERFHHMLRIFKPTSPMNHGSWAMTGYGIPLTLLAGKQIIEDAEGAPEFLKSLAGWVPARAAAIAGIPLALVMASYPGVLLSTTSTPAWSKSRFLGALFSSSALSAGAAATALVLALQGKGDETIEPLEKIERIARLMETEALAAYLITAGEAARPLIAGRQKKLFWLGGVGTGLVAPEVATKALPAKRRGRLMSTIIKSGLALAGGLALKWAITRAGKTSALDADLARQAARPDKSAPGWSA